MIKRIPMIVFVLTLLSLVYMIIIRLNAMGMRLLTMNSRAGGFIARHYNSSVVLFIVMACIFIAVVLLTNHIKSSKHKKHGNTDDEEDAFL